MKIKWDELKRAVEIMGEEGDGRDVSFYTGNGRLEMKTTDKSGEELEIWLYDNNTFPKLMRRRRMS